MNEVFLEMAKQVPVGLAMIFIVYMFLTNENKREEQRTALAKDREQERRNYEIQINSMWASNIKAIIDQINTGNDKIVNALVDHEKMSKERYDKMGITGDLLDAAKELLRKK